MQNTIQAVFIDRDGTLGGDTSITYPREFILYGFAGEAIRTLRKSNIKIFAFTNQPGISDGEATEDEFIKELSTFGIDKAYICPHSEKQNCECRKPKPGMLLKAAKEFDLDLSRCAVIGDRWSDMLAAKKAGTKKILVLTGAGQESLEKYRNKLLEAELDYIATDLLEGVNWILK
jgi:histidinol-phosphate phosphatase family protein